LLYSFGILTIIADAHPLMNHFHKPTDEKRMVAILPPARYQEWLGSESDIMDFMVPFEAE
jgi:hypothetical protein